MSRKVVYKGFIRTQGYGDNDYALFIGDCEEPIAEVFEEDLQGQQVTVRYWTSDKEKTKEELQKGALSKILGSVHADYGDRFSEYTGYLWTDEELNIGGHDLLSELESYLDKYIYLEVEIH